MAICRMTIEEKGKELQEKVLGVGEYWNLIAENYEKENPGKKVIHVEGLNSISATSLDLNTSDRREVIELALHNLAKKEWVWFEATNPPDNDARIRSQTALSMLVELGA